MSIGIAASKTLAKLGSDANKPYGFQVLTGKQAIEQLVATLPVQEITGIAGRSARKLAQHGIATVADFMAADRRLLRKLLTIKGEQLWWELHGQSVIPIVTSRPMHKHLARGGSLGKATGDIARVKAWLARNVERLVEALCINNYVFFQEQNVFQTFAIIAGKLYAVNPIAEQRNEEFLRVLGQPIKLDDCVLLQ